jgi:hypothetical protein
MRRECIMRARFVLWSAAVGIAVATAIAVALALSTTRTSNFDDVAPAVFVSDLAVSRDGHLSWTAVYGSERYVVVGAGDRTKSWWVWEGTQTTVPYGAPLATVYLPDPSTEPPPAGMYRWNVFAYESDGDILAVSTSASFRCGEADGCFAIAGSADEDLTRQRTRASPTAIRSRAASGASGPRLALAGVELR